MQDGMIHEKKNMTLIKEKQNPHTHTQCLMKAENTQMIFDCSCSNIPQKLGK